MERKNHYPIAALNAAWPEALKTYRIERMQTECDAYGCLLLNARAADQFNFVSRVSVTFDAALTKVTDYHCSCRRFRENGEVCAHCAALTAHYFTTEYVTTETVEPAVPVLSVHEAQPMSCESENTASQELSASEAITESEGAAPDAIPMPEQTEISEEIIQPEQTEFCGEPQTMQILFGTDLAAGEPLYWQPNDTEQVIHTNTGIIGTMGTGKTQFTKSLITQLYRSQDRNYDGARLGMLIFDYKGDYNENAKEFVNAVDAKILKPYRIPYNPFALNRTVNFTPLLPVHTANRFKDTLTKIYHLGHKQQQILLECILSAYERQGIDKANPATWNRPAPTFEQVYQVFEQETEGKTPDSLTAAMAKLQQFCIFEAEPARTCSLFQLLKGVVVVDLCGYTRDIQNLIVAITLDQFHAQMLSSGSSATDGRYRQLRKFILVDEADHFMGEDFDSLRNILKEGREFGVGMILSTQSLRHFIGDEDDYSSYIRTWVVHHVNDLKQREVERMMRMEAKSPEVEAVCSAIKELKKHESVVRFSGQAPVTIKDKPFWELYQEISEK